MRLCDTIQLDLVFQDFIEILIPKCMENKEFLSNF